MHHEEDEGGVHEEGKKEIFVSKGGEAEEEKMDATFKVHENPSQASIPEKHEDPVHE